MSYETYLPSVFPYSFQSTPSTIRYMVRQLISSERIGAPLGTSSFAVVPYATNMWTLWLSEVSKKFLVEQMSHIEKNLVISEDDVDA